MLGKLFRYEMQATARIFLPTYLVLLAFAVLSRLSLSMEHFQTGSGDLVDILMAVMVGFYVVAILGVCVVALVVIIRRFYQNLTGDQGYLMFTLPVETWQLVASKLMAALVWHLTTMAAVGASVSILLFRMEFLPDIITVIQMVWNAIRYELGITFAATISLNLIMMFLGMVQGILMIYAAIAIGHTIRGHRILGSVAAYIALSVGWQIISSVVTMLTTGGLFTANQLGAESVWFFLLVGSLLSLAACVLLFFVTVYILGHQLNLE